MGIDNYYVKVAGTWRHTTDPEVHRTDFWIDRHEGDQGTFDNPYYFSGIDEAADFCQEYPETIVGVSPLLLVVIKNKPERWPGVKL
jgi:hypothetical protein